MSEYSGTPPSSLRGPRSPLFGTATFTSVQQPQTPLSSSRHSFSSHSYDGGSSYDSDDVSTDRRMRRINMSPTPDDVSYSYSEEESMYDRAQVEAELTELDDEIQDTLDMWGDPQGQYASTSDNLLDRSRRVLSTITEHTEDISSRPTSFAAGSGRPATQYSTYLGEPSRRSTYASGASPSAHIRSSTDPASASPAPGRPAVSNLIAQFEAKKISPELPGHSRTASAPSAPAGPRSPSPYATSPFSHTTSLAAAGLGYTTSGLGSATGSFYGGSRPSSPTKSRTGSVVSGPRAPPSASGDSRRTPSTHSRSQSEASGYSSTPSRSATSTFTGLTGSASVSPTDASMSIPTAGPSVVSLRRPQGSPRSPLAQVKNVVSAFKAKTPVLRKAQPTSPSRSEGRRRSRRSVTPSMASTPARGRDTPRSDVSPSVTDASRSEGTPAPAEPIPPPFDISQLGETAEPINIGLLWYLNVHEPPPYRWRRCQAVLYPHMLVLTWIVPGGRRGTIMLDLLNCTSVGTALSPQHPQAADDIGAIAAKEQSRQPGDEGLLEMLSPFHLMYEDGTERLGTDSPKERLAWINAIRDALDRPITIPDRSSTRSPQLFARLGRRLCVDDVHLAAEHRGARRPRLALRVKLLVPPAVHCEQPEGGRRQCRRQSDVPSARRPSRHPAESDELPQTHEFHDRPQRRDRLGCPSCARQAQLGLRHWDRPEHDRERLSCNYLERPSPWKPSVVRLTTEESVAAPRDRDAGVVV
ncbi:hypothetical protein PsYK624_024790 [Phanerochaete sordida]|uniref:PH domain-containing protein n=1 Tax=Phanerochaete sordida TaxID=48140 RepID=A0A9P3G1Y9_9APHY|nr:hypothetical protein PsYK624_024790 [Phanerochaete sordida]